MHLKKFVLCASVGVAALVIACGKNSPSPVSPSASASAGSEAGPGGETLKATAPTPVSPVNGDQPSGGLVLVATKSQGKFADIAVSYQFQVLDGTNVVYDSGVVGGVGAGGANVQHTVDGSLEFDKTYSWRARAAYQGAFGPWSTAATFKAPAGGYIRGSEIFDPLTNGKTVGQLHGPTQFIPGKGVRLGDFSAHVTYVLPQTLEAGEFSVMVTGFDEGSPGDKTKIMTMQEGFGDPVTNDYRFTFEKRGSNYVTPGAVTWRIITGDSTNKSYIKDGVRIPVAFSDELWYFWKLTWRTGLATAEVREGGPHGRVIYSGSRATNGHPYRPTPHVIHLGMPIARGGAVAASVPGATYKNVWVSANPRPAFPGEK